MRKFTFPLIACILFLSVANRVKSQTVLATGDIAFTGYISNDPAVQDQFSFVILVPVTANTVIKFTDYGWRTDIGGFANRNGNLESELTLTTNAAFAAGTEITINSNNSAFPAAATATLAGGGSAGTVVTSAGAGFTATNNFSLSGNGDQIFAYQGTFASPTFISGIHMNVYTIALGDPTNSDAANWDGVIPTPATNENATSSGKPAALTTATNAIWIGTTLVSTSEKDNAKYNCQTPITTAAQVRASCNNQANWTTSDGGPVGFTLPTGCNFMGILSSPPSFTTHPSNSTVCAGTNTSFTIVASSATSYQWQVDNGGGFTNITNDATYSGATATTLNVTGVTNLMNGYLYRCVATNGSGSTNSNNATLTVTPLPVNPTLLAKTPATATVADGTPVSATFNAGSGGTGCTDDYRYTTNGGATYLPYTPGSNISTTGLAAGTGFVFIEGRRAACASACQNTYVVLASWLVTPLPAGATTLAAGDIGFSGYSSEPAAGSDEFSFVLLRNIGPGTVLNFTDNGYQAGALTNTEQVITWTSNAAYPAGTEIKVVGLAATLTTGGSAGTVTGTALSLNTTGDQIFAYTGTLAAPTFISGIHMNVYTTAGGDPNNTSAASWDGGVNPISGTTASALPPGLTTGTNAIWIGVPGDINSEFDNAKYGTCSGPGTLGPIVGLRTALNNPANWVKDDINPVVLPTGCPYLGLGVLPPSISVNPANATVCETSPASFSITASGATSYQWQENNGGGFVNIANGGIYSGATTTTLNISAAALSMNGYTYQCIATNGGGSSTSTAAILTVNALPVSPTLLAKTPATVSVADGTPVSATFNAGSGGTGCADDFRYTTDGGLTYLPYTPGSNISTTGLAAGSGFVFIEGRRANCSAGCQGSYKVLASWYVTPLPAAATTLNAGDIGFTSYAASTDEFSFVLLRNIGPGTVINFTNTGWLTTNAFRTPAEETVTWTAPAGGLTGGVEIKIAGLVATRSGGGAAGTVTGTALSLNINGDQILAYRGTPASPTFISAIHMNVYSVANGDPTSTSAAAWDGTAYNATPNSNPSALPVGLTTGVNAIWIGTPDVIGSEFDNAAYGTCAGPGTLGPLTGLRAALNNQANWVRNNNVTPGFAIPTGCNYLSVLCPTVTVTNPGVTTGTAGTPFSQTFTATGGTTPHTFTTASTLPTGLTLSTAGVLSGTPTQSGTFPIVVTATEGGGCSGSGTTYNLVISCQTITVTNPVNTAGTAGTAFSETFTETGSIGGATFSTVSTLPAGLTLSAAGILSGTPTEAGTFPIVVMVADGNGCTGTGATYNLVISCPAPILGVATPSSQSRCSGQNITAIVLSGAPAGATYNWTRDNTGTVTGIAGSGSGNITGSLTNTTAAPITVTFTITPTYYGTCTGTPYTATVTVSPNPPAPTVTGGGVTVCAGTTVTLTGPADPNYTYQWQRRLATEAFANLGTAQTQAVTSSGIYQLVVTNQFGCSATSATTTVIVADYIFNGSLATGDLQQTGRLNRFAQVSNCAAPKPCPGTFTTTGARLYDLYTVTNPRNVPVCATVGITSGCGTNIFNVAYTTPFNPTVLCTNYLADPGSSPAGAATLFFEVNIPANGSIDVVVHEVNTGTGCAGYTLSVDVPRDPGAITASPGTSSCSGNPITLTAPAANTYSWSPGGATTQAIVVSAPGTTNYTVNLGYGNNGCTDTRSQSITIANPTVNTVSNQYACAGSAVNVPFTGTGATNYNWTNTNTAIGLAASGSGDLNFTATNATAAPITGTITVTPVNGACSGTPVTFTITVSPIPTITSVTNGAFCAPSGVPVPALAATGNGTINWYDALTGGNLVNSGNSYSPTLNATTTFYVESVVPSGPVTNLAMPAQNATFPGNVRGYWFTAPTDFVITSLFVPTTASSGVQHIAVLKFNGNTPPPVFSASTNAFTTLFLTRNNPASGRIACNIPVAAGEVIGILGNRANLNSYAPGDYATTIAGFPVQLERLGMQFQLSSTNPRDIWREFGPTTSISRIEFEYSPGPACSSSPRTLVTATMNAVPVATATPASQTVCSGAITPIVLTSSEPGTTYAWTRDNTVNVTGIPAAGSGSTISGTLTNNTTVPQTVTFTIIPTSGAGCVGASITATVTVNAVPTITCPANITISNAAGQCGNTATYTQTVTGIPVPTLSYTFTGATTGSGSGNGSGSFFNVGTTTVTITATNSCGSANCSFTVTVNDTENPTITCPAAVTVSCAAAVPAVNTASVTAADNCPGVVVTHIGDVISAQTCANRYTVTRTYRATDAAGNFVECTQIITVNDNTPPTLTCPAPVTVSCAALVPAPNTASVTGVSDNCAGVVTVTHIGDVISAQTCANRFTVTRTYRATDVCGNFAECTQIITVNDNTPPTLTCPAPVTVSCAALVPAANIALVTGVSDNCAGVVTVTHVGDVISNQTCANRFTVTRTYRATDVCGNFAECTQIITVNDQTPPVLTCPAPVTVSCAANVPAPNIAAVTGVSDNCAGVVTVTHQGDVISAQTCANRYTVTRTYRATDVCGNFAECTQIITVNDQTPPTITCPAPITVSCAAAVPAPNTALVTATDNCAGTVTITHISDVISNQTCANRYTVTRTYRATDVCGNFSQCTQIITVNDQTPPVVTCPAPVTVSCAAAVPAPNIALVTATDNCAGTITITHIGDVISNQTCPNRFTVTRTYRATDVCGNFAECTQVITVNDQTAPVITCPANISVTTPVGSCTAVVNFTVTATDNCAGPITIVSSPASGFAFPIGTTTVTSTATDACGNSSTCTFTVTVADAQLPTITAQPQNRTVCVGQNATFSVTAVTAPSANGPLAYQWQQWNGTAWVNVAGATASSYTINTVTQAMNTNTFRVQITGLCTTIFSNPATLTVNPLPSITLNASPLAALLPPQITTITATVNPTGGSFVWSLNGTTIPGATGNTLGPINVNGIGAYQAVYTDPNGCVSSSAVLNITAMASSNLWVYPVPNTGTFNVRFYNQTGEAATLKVYNGLGQVIYQQALTLGITYSNITVNLGNVPAGVYIVKVVNSSNLELAAKRIVVYHP